MTIPAATEPAPDAAHGQAVAAPAGCLAGLGLALIFPFWFVWQAILARSAKNEIRRALRAKARAARAAAQDAWCDAHVLRAARALGEAIPDESIFGAEEIAEELAREAQALEFAAKAPDLFRSLAVFDAQCASAPAGNCGHGIQGG